MTSSRLSFVVACAGTAVAAHAQEKLHYTYMWHMEQPIYWPDQQTTGPDRYESAWESIQRTDGGALHPSNNLREIFGKDDRVAAYQYRVKDSVSLIDHHPEAGVQVSYSGGLIMNVDSLGAASQLGYTPTWFNDYRIARGWSTQSGKPRCDIVLFSFHHALCPLIAESTFRKEIQIYKEVYDDAWGATPTYPGLSKGFFPSETAFSTRMIKVLDEEGVDWSFVSGEHISRACADFPTVLGTGGVVCDPPNPADQMNPAQSNYYRVQIDRGCSPAEAYPFAFTPHRAQHVDPATGQVYEIVVVPTAQAIGWEDGYNQIGTGHFDAIQPGNDPARPMLAVLAHDGDNAWGGGYSYYMEAVPNLANSSAAAGYVPSTVEEYLADHPVPAGDIVHVEDGAWVNADGDFGSPQFWNWNWPPVDGSGNIDIAGGWAEDIRNWAVITAAQNHVDTAEQIWAGTVDPHNIVYPEAGANAVERAWHYFLGSLNSGYMYYGSAEDFEVKATIACNEALQHTAAVIGDASGDLTGPAVWIPQRWPWNPGETNYGAAYGHIATVMPTDMWVWTFVHDVSDTQSVTLYYRVDNDGTNPLGSHENEKYAGGAEVGAWQMLAMTGRAFPAGNFHNDPGIDFFEMPQEIADQYYAEVSGLSDVLVDYYVEAIDTKSNVTKSDIQHVWIGDGEGSNGGGNNDPRVEINPDPAIANQNVTVSYDAAGGPLAAAGIIYMHYGFDGWASINPTEPAMTFNAGTSLWEATVGVAGSATQFDVVFNDGLGNWDSNGGADWHFTVDGGSPGGDEFVIDGSLDVGATLIATNNGVSLWAGLDGSTLYMATQSAGGGQDRFILLAGEGGAGVLQAPMWGKGGQVAAWEAFMGNEESNNWHGWFDNAGAAEVASGSVLEGTIELIGQYGSVPNAVYAAVALYASPDGGALDSAKQVGPTVNTDGNIDAVEYVLIDLCALGLDCCAADVTTTGAGAGDPSYGVPDGQVTGADINYYVNAWVAGNAAIADLTTTGAGVGDSNYGVPDGQITGADINYYVNLWVAGCL